MNVLIVNYNTQELTDACIRSVNGHTDGCCVYVWDNSDLTPFVNSFGNVDVIDNTGGRYVDWERWLKKFDKYPKVGNNYGSAKHCYSVDYFMKISGEPFVLLDSDTVVKRDLTPLWDEGVLFTGEVDNSTAHFINIPRVLPYCCFINTPLCRKHDVSYFNRRYMWKLTKKNPNRFYDTGAWFFRSCMDACPDLFRTIRYDDYVTHIGSGSWKT